ncbi:MAG: alpha/beta hydrolase [Lachnospiraceae bacterium]|nr:alpha/beta hydrolase [Lachnospiraceae bacterium]
MGYVTTENGISLYYEEYGEGDRIILSAQAGFYPAGMQQALAKMGYHVYCMTLRGFAPSSYITEDYGEEWYDIFAADVICLADAIGAERFIYMGASHGAGVGWHLMLKHPGRALAFVAVVPGPHSLKEGTMSYRQMMMQGLISSPPPFDPPIRSDDARSRRRKVREDWLSSLPEADPREKQIDYGRPLLYCKTEEKLLEELRKIETPTLILGGAEDPISTPELMMRTACALPNCKLIMYSNCGHNIDTDIVEELCEETDRFLKQLASNGKYYSEVRY